jgi:hypothetical protein
LAIRFCDVPEERAFCALSGLNWFDRLPAARALKAGIVVCANRIPKEVVDSIDKVNINQACRFGHQRQ